MKRLRQHGMTIIEIMISMLVGSLLVIAVMLVLGGMGPRQSAEGSRRSLGSVADLDQSAAIATYQLDKWIRSAGQGLGQTVKGSNGYSYAYGCKLFAAKSSSQILPFTGTFPAPFDDSTKFLPSADGAGIFRLIPALIIPNATTPNMTSAVSTHTSDALVLMASGNSYGSVPLMFSSSATSNALTVLNTTTFSGASYQNLALVADSQIDTSTNKLADCMVTQVNLTTTDGSATTIPLGGTGTSWYQATIGTQSMSSYSSSAVAVDLGNPASSSSAQPPSFLAVGVGDNDTLFAYDLLNVRTPALQGVGQNVFEMHALYGVETGSDGVIDSWVSPSSGSYTVAALTAGTVDAAKLIKRIRAVRVGLILRTDLPEKDTINTSTTLTLFNDLSSYVTPFTRTLTGAELNYRYRTIEVTIPVRNNYY